MNEYEPPFPWFGGKSAVADALWGAFDSRAGNYVEPFGGSLTALMRRPGFDWRTGAWLIPEPTETVNDADVFVANFWRASKIEPEAVADHADWPVSECDLHARHVWLNGQREPMTRRLMGDPDWYDPKAAGWWVWGQCCWIAGGWCSGRGPWTSVDGLFVRGDEGGCVNRKLPHLGDAGRGVNRQLPHLGSAGQGVDRQIPHLGCAGQGAERQYREHLRSYISRLRDRLRRVRVCCGDWSRVCGPAVTFKHGTTAVLLDPPYSAEAGRDMGCYSIDCGSVAHAVREWAIAHGDNPLMRIALCGYDTEHAMPDGWRVYRWKAHGGYGNQGDGPGRENAARETIWFSPHCLPIEGDSLFAGVGGEP